jgi:aspartate/methionine/tyrosine aminotransferase
MSHVPLRTQSSRLAAVQAPMVPIVSRWTAETPGTISLGQGVVSWGPPQEAIDALRDFGADPASHRYGPVEGDERLVEAMARKLAADNRIVVGTDARIVVTAGSNMAFFYAILALCDPGDEVVLLAPYYFNHEMAVVMSGCRPVPVPTDARCQPRPDAIARALTPRTRAVVTISPNNPTGAVYPEAILREINALCAERGIFHVHDEAYEYFTYGQTPHFSPGSLPGAAAHTISLFSLSKTYGLAGWRIGFMVIPASLADAVAKIQDTILICPPAASQHAARAALEVGPAYCQPKIRALDEVRRLVAGALEPLADICEAAPAEGAFYVFLRVKTGLDPITLTERLIREHRVAVLPGTTFGAGDGCTLRISYGALDRPSAAEGMARLASGLRALAGRDVG